MLIQVWTNSSDQRDIQLDYMSRLSGKYVKTYGKSRHAVISYKNTQIVATSDVGVCWRQPKWVYMEGIGTAAASALQRFSGILNVTRRVRFPA
jgi:hypothetical protein